MNTPRILRAFQRTLEQTFRTYNPPARLTHHPQIRIFPTPQRIQPAQQRRYQSATEEPPHHQPSPLTDRPETSQSDAEAIATRKALSPAYQLHFTCKKCLERSSHTVSKQAYHFGTTVIHCPQCKTQHLISDHLKIFSDKKKTLEEIAGEFGEVLRKGRLGVEGDVEFYEEGADEVVEGEFRRRREEMRAREATLREQQAREGGGDQVDLENLEAASVKVQGLSAEERREQQAMDERIRDALRETSRRQGG